jgi:hypothetical protein
MYAYYYHNRKHVCTPLGIENMNNGVFFEDTGLPEYFII